MDKWGVKISLLALIISFFVHCQTNKSNNEEKLILTTTGMLGDAAHQLIGEHVKIESLMGVGVDPHLYKATQQDIKKLQKADLIIYNGLHLEGKLQDILKKFSKVKSVYCFTDSIDSNLFLVEEQNKIIDPHIWFDMEIWKEGLTHLAQELQRKFPQFKMEIEANLIRYIAEIDSKTDSLVALVSTIPKEQRILITSHDAFRYFGRTFGIKVLGLQGISTASELGIRDRLALVDFIIENKVPSVFLETTVSSKPMEAVIEDCKRKGHQVKLGGALLSDALGDKEKNQHTLLGMLEYNVTTIVNELKNE